MQQLNQIIKYLFLSVLVVTASFAYAQEEAAVLDEEVTEATDVSLLTLGDIEIEYGEVISIEAGELYYDESTEGDEARLVASAHDTDGDELVDAWFVYNTNDLVTTEAYDYDGDEIPDLVLQVDEAGSIQTLSGDMASDFERSKTQRFVPETPTAPVGTEEDLVGDVSDIVIGEEDSNWIFFVLLLLAGGAVYLFWQRQQNS